MSISINRRTCDNCYYRRTCTLDSKNLKAPDNDLNPGKICEDFKQAGISCGNVMTNGLGLQWIE